MYMYVYLYKYLQNMDIPLEEGHEIAKAAEEHHEDVDAERVGLQVELELGFTVLRVDLNGKNFIGFVGDTGKRLLREALNSSIM